MIKKLLLISTVVAMFSACNNAQVNNNENSTTNDSTEVKAESESTEIPTVNINNFDSLAAKYVDKRIQVQGTCVHTCKHGGGKMHLVGENPDNRVVVIATDESGKFNADMEGSVFIVVGTVEETRIDSAYLANWEAEILKGEQESEGAIKHKHGAKGDNATEAEEREMKLAQIDNLRQELKESGKDYLGFYNLKCVSYKEVEQ